ncbi:hypothetical protein ABFS83_02G137700 [Erythranthe nasuta]
MAFFRGLIRSSKSNGSSSLFNYGRNKSNGSFSSDLWHRRPSGCREFSRTAGADVTSFMKLQISVMTHDGDGGGNNGGDGGELKNGNNFGSEVGLSFAAGPKFINESGPSAIGDWKKLIKYFNCYFQILIIIIIRVGRVE